MAKFVGVMPATKEQWAAKKIWRTAAYCRVSTACEEQMGSLAAQQQFYASMIEAHPGWTNAGIFSDQSTGLNAAERPGFQTMMRLCRKKKIDLILTKSFSRLGRNTLDMMKAIRELRRLKVDIYFEKEGVWLHQQEADLLITAYCAISQAESESMSRNIKWGIHQGFPNGTSGYADFVCYGYKRGDYGELSIDESDAAVVRHIFKRKPAATACARYQTGCMNVKFFLHQGRDAGVREPSESFCEMKNTQAMSGCKKHLWKICSPKSEPRIWGSWRNICFGIITRQSSAMSCFVRLHQIHMKISTAQIL